MTPERRKIPEWAKKERLRDFEWIRENLRSFWPLAKEVFKEAGRGAIVVDTTSQSTGEGNPYGYFSQEDLEKLEDEDTDHMINNYDPDVEFVILLLKPRDRTSTYRIQALQPGKK